MPLLPEDLVRELCRAAVSAGLDRDGLLATIHPSIVSGLARAPALASQLLLDLSALNRTGEIRDGSVPLRTWIENAILMVDARKEEEVFERALGALAGAAGGRSSRRSPRTYVLLLLTANPSSTTRLSLDTELREIDQALLAASHRDDLRVVLGPAARATDIPELLMRHTPDIVHFSGHGSPQGELWFHDEAGGVAPVEPAVLGAVFAALRDPPVRGVVLNACFTATQADKILDHVEFVVGMSTAIKDSAARRFAGTFYQALVFGRSLETAFRLGCVQIGLAALGQSDIPRLLVRSGLRAEDIYLIRQK